MIVLDLDSREPWYRRLLPYALLFLAAVALYLKSVGYDFIDTWDDADYLLDNPLVQSFSREHLAAIFGAEVMSNYAPLHLLSFSLEYWLWGANPAGYHAVNIIVHAANACLACVILRVLTRDGLISFWAALLFVLHPVNVENVAWVSESKTLFATFFMFAALLLYLRHLRTGGRSSAVLSVLSFLAAGLFKSVVVPLPLAILAYHAFLAEERPAWKTLAALGAISVLTGALAVWAQASGGAVDRQEMALDVLLGLIYPTMLPVYWKYLVTFLAPISLSGLYDTTMQHSFREPVVLLSLAGIIVLLVLVFWKGNGQVRFWTAWICVFMLPEANIIPLPVYYADRYVYHEVLGFSVLLLMAVRSGMGWMTQNQKWLRVAFAVFVLTYGILAFQRLDVWHDDLEFWEDTAKKSPNIWKTRLNRGISYEMHGRLEEAEREILISLLLYPTDNARYSLGIVNAKLEYARRQGLLRHPVPAAIPGSASVPSE